MSDNGIARGTELSGKELFILREICADIAV
jgi:hypothetical protein